MVPCNDGNIDGLVGGTRLIRLERGTDPQTLSLPFWKVESIGNDFVLMLESDFNEFRPDIPFLCDRRFGIGSDGILVVRREGENVVLRMFNSDGSEDFCGNGIRCAAHFARVQGWVKNRFNIFHGGQDIPIQLLDDGLITTGLGPATYDPRVIPTTVGELFDTKLPWGGSTVLRGSVLSTGSAHVVLQVDEFPEDDVFFEVSPQLENLAIFPERVSVMWAKQESADHVRIRIWERGVGETLGCGTGATATALDVMRRRGSGGAVRVESKGGHLTIQAEQWDARPTLIGQAHLRFSGNLRNFVMPSRTTMQSR